MDIRDIVTSLRDCVSKKAFTQRNLFAVVEEELLRQIMHECKYNQSRACEKLGISRTNLKIKLERYFGNEYKTRG